MTKKTKNEAKKNAYLLPKLVNLGLSKQEAQIYLVLLEEGPQTAKNISKSINIYSPTVYRTARKLEKRNLIAILKTSPRTFQALPPQLSIPSYVKEKSISLEKNADEITKIMSQKIFASSSTNVNLIFGINELFTESIKLINEIKKELLIISIGELITEELLLSINQARQRGVKILMIVHKNDKENKQILENFKKNGFEIRHYPDWGFHLNIYDSKKSIITVNNPQNTKERVSMEIFSLGLSKALRDYFYSVWEKATPV